MPLHIAILRYDQLPDLEGVEMEEGAEEMLLGDEALLQAAFEERGVEVEIVSWKDSRLLTGEFDRVITRSTWDYIEGREEFLATIDAIEASGCRVSNSPETIRWSSEKSYLIDLQEMGVATVPTFRTTSDWTVAMQKDNWKGAILKPIVGAGGKDVELVEPGDIGARVAERLREDGGGFLIQPFIESVRNEGETSYVLIGGKFSHAILRRPKQGDFRAHALYGGSTELINPSASDLREIEDMASKLPFKTVFARFDVVRHAGRLVVMELELIEPVLYLSLFPPSAGALADAMELPRALTM